MRSLPVSPRLLFVAIALVIGGAAAFIIVSDGSHPDPKPETGTPPANVVDRASAGGRCSDGRSARNARSVSSPWCSLARAVEAAPAGALILVRRGSYGDVDLAGNRTKALQFRAYPRERVTLGGVNIGSGKLRLQGFEIEGGVNIQGGAARIAIVDNRIITDGSPGKGNLNIEAGAREVLIAGNRLAQQPPLVGANAINFNSTNTLPPIENVTIRDNKIGPVRGGDAIQAKNTRNLTIEGNEISEIVRPKGPVDYHPDALQSIYGATNLSLRGNFIHDIAAQGVNLQAYISPNRGFDAKDNVITRVAYPFTAFSFDASNVRIEHNTIDGLLLPQANTRKARIVANIATYGLTPDPGAQVAREDYNLAQRYSAEKGPHSIVGDPTYRGPSQNDFTLAPGSRGYRAGPDREDLGARRPRFPRSR